jgi:hypothetical protein
METKQMMSRLFAKIKAEIRSQQIKTESDSKQMKEEITATLEAKVPANNDII